MLRLFQHASQSFVSHINPIHRPWVPRWRRDLGLHRPWVPRWRRDWACARYGGGDCHVWHRRADIEMLCRVHVQLLVHLLSDVGNLSLKYGWHWDAGSDKPIMVLVVRGPLVVGRHIEEIRVLPVLEVIAGLFTPLRK